MISEFRRSRRAIALLVTMIFIVLMLGFAALFYDRANRAFARIASRDATLQTSALLYQIAKTALSQLTRTARKEANAICAIAEDKAACREEVLIEAYDIFYKLPLFLELGESHIALTCSPFGQKLDINSLKVAAGTDENNRDQPVFRRREIVQRYLQDKFRLYSTWQFFELLDFVFDETGEKYAYLAKDSRLNVANSRLERGRVGSARVLRLIAEDYAELSHDTAAKNIDWEALFSFDGGGAIDYDNMSPESCDMIFGAMPGACEKREGERVKEADMIARYADANRTIADFGVKFGFNPALNCRVSYNNDKVKSIYSFKYDSDTEKLSGFKIEN